MFPWSVIPSAGCPSAAAAATTSSTRDAPSSIENSVWTCRWVKLSDTCVTTLLGTVHTPSTAVVHRLWTDYTDVISEATVHPPRQELTPVRVAHTGGRPAAGRCTPSGGFVRLLGLSRRLRRAPHLI